MMRVWAAQIAAILRLEIAKNFLRKRAIPIYLLAFAPAILLALRGADSRPSRVAEDMAAAQIVYAGIFQLFYLRLAVFFGCVVVFTSLLRGDVIEKSLHYYFLAPVRREVLLAGKYLAGLLATGAIFTAGASLSFVLLYVPYGPVVMQDFFLAGPGLGQLGAYAGAAALGCVGYGAVFLMMGLVFRNPLIPAALVMGWEAIHFLLPPALKKLSVIHYLLSLCPVPFTEAHSFGMMAEPTPAWLAVAGLAALTAAVLVFAGARIRRMEITYGTD